MNASVDFIIQDKEDILVIPVDAVYKENSESFVLIKQNNSKVPLKVAVRLGISDDKNIEVISGLTEKDRIIAKTKKFILPKSSTGSNPFMPFRKR
jgi:multidrug efflux pump subunit AcrA (membrane-fusion protein)